MTFRPIRFLPLLICLVLAGSVQAAAKKEKQEPDRDPWASVWLNQPKKPLPAGTTYQKYYSKSMKREVGYCVYLPPQYAKNARQRFPVIYELHGNGGNELSNNATVELLDKTIKAGKCPPFIMVMPNGGLAIMYNDSLDGKLLPDTAIVTELIPLIDKTYRTVATREGRGIEGFSMGGHGAAKLAFKYPELFGSVIGWAGGMQHIVEKYQPSDDSKMDARNRKFYGNDLKKYEADDPFYILKQNADKIRGRTKILLVCGTADGFHLKGTRDLHKLLDELQIEHEYKEVPDIEHQQTKLREPFGDTCFQTHVRQ